MIDHRCFTAYGKPKRKFDTLEEAIDECKIRNKDEKRIHKLVSYKCPICYKFHIGTNGKLLEQKINIYNNEC